jgi:hypothetical protein
MTDHQLVCPFDAGLLARLKGRSLVIRSSDVSDIPEIEAVLAGTNQLQAVLIESCQQLSDVLPCLKTGQACLDIYVSGPGRFRDIAPHIAALRTGSSRIFMPAGVPENLTAARILSSLGVTCGLSFDGTRPDWEKVSDLMHYAVYGKYPHAPIEPFHYVTSRYQPCAQLPFGAVYFDDPAKYLHISTEGHIASSRSNLEAGNFISRDLAELDNMAENPEYQAELNRWRGFFLEDDGCAYCEAWRVCMGRYSSVADEGACEKFFSELMEAAEYTRSGQQVAGW